LFKLNNRVADRVVVMVDATGEVNTTAFVTVLLLWFGTLLLPPVASSATISALL
jgi:hypothetical protein